MIEECPVSTSPTHVLILGTVWPEPTSSAAGLHHWSLIRAFQKTQWEITYVSPSSPNHFCRQLENAGVNTKTFLPNDSTFDAFIRELKPDYAVFDRFILEEQFGWRVRENSPHTVRIVDTEDLHFLRRTRQAALKANIDLESIFDAKLDFNNEDSVREVASIYRSDCTLIISDFEMHLLREDFEIPKNLLRLFRFCYEKPQLGTGFESQKNFVMIGNFRHPPNADATRWLYTEIWPKIREEFQRRHSSPSSQSSTTTLPELHLYGAYPSREIMSLNNPKIGFHVKGPAENQYETLARYRVNLAPLRFGAGIKGKISDGWWCGLPVVTTPIGKEGMQTPDGNFGGFECRTLEDFVTRAVDLYTDATLWKTKRDEGIHTLKSLFDAQKNYDQLIVDLEDVQKNIKQFRRKNFIGEMLWHHLHKSTTYFSRWIELKNRLN